MPLLPRFLEQHDERADHARKLERTIVDLGVSLKERKHYHDPADTRTLRGIPAIGRGVAGAIAGTSPGARW